MGFENGNNMDASGDYVGKAQIEIVPYTNEINTYDMWQTPTLGF